MMKYLIATFLFFACWLVPNCGADPVVQSVKIKYPTCIVQDVDRSGNVVKITLACPYNQTKIVIMHDRS